MAMYSDETERIKHISDVLSRHNKVLVPENLKDSFNRVCSYLSTYRTPSPSPVPSHSSSYETTHVAVPEPLDDVEKVRYNVKLTNKTVLDVLYTHAARSLVEFPCTSKNGRIGHLFHMDDQSGSFNPMQNFVYSHGDPKGSSGSQPVTCALLVDDEGNEVPCKESHSTCQGSKVCPFGNMDALRTPHFQASRTNLEQCLLLESKSRSQNCPQKELFQRTLAFFVAVKKQGCATPISAENINPSDDIDPFQAQALKGRRGHFGRSTCKGQIIFEHGKNGNPVLRCEFYNRYKNRDHYINIDIGRGSYDDRYLEALFLDDREVIAEYEDSASEEHDVGPRSWCTTVSNFSAIQVNCESEHRNDDGSMVIAELIHLKCKSKFRMYQPIAKYRASCPRVLVICHGEHTHPIPLPTKTPTSIKLEIYELLKSMSHDLPDLTARRFLRHQATEVFLKSKLPSMVNPAMIDLHPSLGNRDHIRSLILKAREEEFPFGTGWEGVLYLKKKEEEYLSPSEVYIRTVLSMPYTEFKRMSTDDDDLADEADTIDLNDEEAPFRMVICMFPGASKRLKSAQYLQCDIGFKRIAGFKEFELGGLDLETRMSITYCRVYVNRQNAVAHCMIFDAIDQIVYNDTGESLRWRHLHAQSPNEFIGILEVSVDQHGGQAKGLGMHLVKKAKMLPKRYDLHEPGRLIQELSEYEHLRRFLRLCENHFFRNIKKTQVPENVRTDMRSLACMEHADWDATLKRIETLGEKAGKDWLNDKIRSKFVFPAICWKMSFIPREIWQVGDRTTNIIESVHFDVNQEGTSCTLVGGLRKGHYFDKLKFKTISNLQRTGVSPSYRKSSISNSVTRSLKRKARSQHKSLISQDDKIVRNNKRLRKTYEAKVRAEERLDAGTHFGTTTDKMITEVGRTSQAYAKAVEESLQSVRTGTGKVGILLPRTLGHGGPPSSSSM